MAGPRRLRLTREWLLVAGAIGVVAGMSFAADRYACTRMDDYAGEAQVRDLALESFVDERCEALDCEQVEIVARGSCVAKIDVRAERMDRYGEVVGTFLTTEGLTYSPALRRWRVREVLADRQLLGLPNP